MSGIWTRGLNHQVDPGSLRRGSGGLLHELGGLSEPAFDEEVEILRDSEVRPVHPGERSPASEHDVIRRLGNGREDMIEHVVLPDEFDVDL